MVRMSGPWSWGGLRGDWVVLWVVELLCARFPSFKQDLKEEIELLCDAAMVPKFTIRLTLSTPRRSRTHNLVILQN